MKTLKLLGAALAAVMMTLSAQAEKTAKAVLENDGKTLRFVYDETNYGTKGTKWFSVAEAEACNSDEWKFVPWEDCYENVTNAVFDASFAAYKPKHCIGWFWYFESLKSVEGLANLKTSEATSVATH